MDIQKVYMIFLNKNINIANASISSVFIDIDDVLIPPFPLLNFRKPLRMHSKTKKI